MKLFFFVVDKVGVQVEIFTTRGGGFRIPKIPSGAAGRRGSAAAASP